MSSSEQAPEPTMDEILASIRKIISDDEPGESPQPEAVATEQVAPAAVAEDGLAADLANALNDTQAGAEEADDILDLTQIVEDQPQAAEAQPETPLDDVLQAALDAAPGAVEAPAPESVSVPAPQVAQDEAGEIDIASLLAEAGVQDTVAEAPAEPQAPAAEDIGAGPEQDNEPAAPVPEDAPISEALSAMSPTAGEPVVEAVQDAVMTDAALPESEPALAVQLAEPESAPAAPVEASLDIEAPTPEAGEQEAISETPEIPEAANDMMAAAQPLAEPAAAPEAPLEAALVLEAPVEELAPAEEPVPVEEPAPMEDSPQVVESASAEEQVAPAETAGGADKTLEDSVKEVLRPMLREWLDDNMERIVQDEVASEKIKKLDS